MYNLNNYLDDEAIVMLDAINIEELVSFVPDDETRRIAFILYLKGCADATKQQPDSPIAETNMTLDIL